METVLSGPSLLALEAPLVVEIPLLSAEETAIGCRTVGPHQQAFQNHSEQSEVKEDLVRLFFLSQRASPEVLEP